VGVKEIVMELLRAGRTEELRQLVAADRRAARPLLGRLWDPVPEVRRTVGWTLGKVAAFRELAARCERGGIT